MHVSFVFNTRFFILGDIDNYTHVCLFSQFLPWYAEAIDAAQQTAVGFQNLVKSRRTVHKFDATEVDDGVLRRALECAIAAPNRRGTEVSET